MRPFRQKTIIEAVDKASKVINNIYNSAKRMSTGIRKESKIAGSAFNRFTTSIGMNVKKATVSLNNLNARVNRVGYNIKKQLGTLGLAVGFTALAMVAGNTIKKFATFEQANANLASVMATATQPELKLLQDDAKRLGAITARTSTEVVSLQESLARLGFETPEILNMTQSIISGSVAMQGELSETANLVGAMIKSFDKFTDIDTPDIIDQMTVATQKSALNFEKLNTMLPTVAGAANAAGIPFNRLLALLGKLSDAGIDASSSSTALRNIILQSGKQGKNYEEILADIVSQQDKLTTSMNEFGVRAAVPATVLAGKLNETLTLSADIMNSTGAAAKAEAKTLDTLTGATTILGSAWEGYILSIEDGKGSIGAFLKDAVRMTTEVLSIATGTEKLTTDMTAAELRIRGFAETAIKVLKVLKAVTIAFVVFKVAVVALRIATFAYNVVLGVQSGLLKASHKSMKGNIVATKVMNTVIKATTSSAMLMNIVLGAAAVAIGIAVYAIIKYNKEAIKAKISTNELNKELGIEKKKANDLFDALRKTNPESEARQKIVDKLNTQYPSLLKNYDLEKAGLDEIAKAQKTINDQILITISTKLMEQDIDTVIEKASKKSGKSMDRLLDLTDNYEIKGLASQQINTYLDEIKSGEKTVDEASTELAKLMDISKKVKVYDESGRIYEASSKGYETIKNELENLTKYGTKLDVAKQNIESYYKGLQKSIGIDGSVVVKNEAIKTDASDKLTDAILLNAKITEQNTDIQKANKDEWKGKFKTYIAKDYNISESGVTEKNITSELAKTAINNKNNVINKQNELLSKTAINTESNVFKNTELAKEAIRNESNIINHTSLNELNKSNINNKSTELIRNLVNESNFVESDIIRENEITRNVANISNTDLVTQRDIVEQKEVQNVRNESNVSNQTKNNQTEGKITINVVDKTGGNYALEVESTGVETILTGNNG